VSGGGGGGRGRGGGGGRGKGGGGVVWGEKMGDEGRGCTLNCFATLFPYFISPTSQF